MKVFSNRIKDWQHWPFGVFYFPLFFVWIYYCIRSRSLWFFSTSNPFISFGGFEGESKREVYALLPELLYPRTIYIEPGLSEEALIQKVQLNEFQYPFIVKPDIGMEGILFRKVDQASRLIHYHKQMTVDYLIQDFSTLPLEVSIFYYRYPGNEKGVITAFIQKELLSLRGNGSSTVSELITKRSISEQHIKFLKREHAANWNTILSEGEELVLSFIGNRIYGAQFIDLSEKINENLIAAFDAISHFSGSFYYGRYDIKCQSIDEMILNNNFTILEFNGAGSIPNHIYTGHYSIGEAYREIIRHWTILFHISRINNKQGVPYTRFTEGWKYLKKAKKHFRYLKAINIK